MQYLHLSSKLTNSDWQNIWTLIKYYDFISVNLLVFYVFCGLTALVGPRLFIFKVSKSHSDTPVSVELLWTNDWPVAQTCKWQYTQHSQETNIHVPSGIRTPNPSKRVTADPLFRPRSHRDRPEYNTERCSQSSGRCKCHVTIAVYVIIESHSPCNRLRCVHEILSPKINNYRPATNA